MPERAGRDTPNLEVAGSKPIPCKVLLIRGLLPEVVISLFEAAFLSFFFASLSEVVFEVVKMRPIH